MEEAREHEPTCLWTHTIARLTRLQVAERPLTATKLIAWIIMVVVVDGFIVWMAITLPATWEGKWPVVIFGGGFFKGFSFSFRQAWIRREEIGRRHREVYGPCDQCEAYLARRRDTEKREYRDRGQEGRASTTSSNRRST